MYNRRYEKVFLMLRQETAGYAISKRPPWGSCVMELKNGKGKLHLTVQGLKPLSYDVYVMAGEESIFCGEIRPDRKDGRCELKWSFDPDTVGRNKTAEDFHTIIILAADGKGGLSAPLTAYFKEKRNWKQDFVPRKKEEYREEEITLQAAEVVLALPPKPVIETAEKKEEMDTNSKIAEAQKTSCQGSIHGSFQGLLAKFRQELEELEETGVLTAEETENIRSIGKEPAPSQMKMQEKTEMLPRESEEQPIAKEESAGSRTKQGENLFVNNRELEPFGDNEKWKCLSLDELSLLSQVPLKWQKEFFFLLPYRRYHHLILQETEEGVWLGLPDHYNAADEADAGEFGFGEFRRVDGDWGYWMAFLKRDS